MLTGTLSLGSYELPGKAPFGSLCIVRRPMRSVFLAPKALLSNKRKLDPKIKAHSFARGNIQLVVRFGDEKDAFQV